MSEQSYNKIAGEDPDYGKSKNKTDCTFYTCQNEKCIEISQEDLDAIVDKYKDEDEPVKRDRAIKRDLNAHANKK